MPSSRVPHMILLGGEDASGQIVGQVMSSADGVSWRQVSPSTSSATARRGASFASDGFQVCVSHMTIVERESSNSMSISGRDIEMDAIDLDRDSSDLISISS